MSHHLTMMCLMYWLGAGHARLIKNPGQRIRQSHASATYSQLKETLGVSVKGSIHLADGFNLLCGSKFFVAPLPVLPKEAALQR